MSQAEAEAGSGTGSGVAADHGIQSEIPGPGLVLKIELKQKAI